MSITKAQLKTLRIEMQAALNKAGITGFQLEVGNMSFTATDVNIKVKGVVKTANGKVAKTANDTMFEQRVKQLGLKMISGDGKYTLTGYKASRYKYPFTMKGPQGGNYKCSEFQAKSLFG
jgi:hypothetical protein